MEENKQNEKQEELGEESNQKKGFRFFPKTLNCDSVDIGDDGNLKIRIAMSEDELEEFIKGVEEFNRYKEAIKRGEKVELRDEDTTGPLLKDLLG